jgi:uncharacterized membrane protein (UPF0127 family)
LPLWGLIRPGLHYGGRFRAGGAVAVTAVIAAAILTLVVRSKGGPKGVLILSFVAFLAASCTGGTADSELRTMTIDNSEGEKVEVRVEIADDASERERGLMERTELGENRGMLFVFEEQHKLSFWMKDTRIPLSIAYIDSEGRIVDIQDMKPFDDELPNYISAEPARYALEVNRGFFEERGVEVGDRAKLPK